MSEVQFNGLKGNYGFYQNESAKPAVKEEKAEEKAVAPETKSVAPDKVLDAMSFLGAQNLAQVKGKLPVDPSKHLTADRISSIEDSMAVFEEGVQKYAEVIKAEFGNSFSDSTVLALAADAFALNG